MKEDTIEHWKMRWEAVCCDRNLLDECNIKLNFEVKRLRAALEKIHDHQIHTAGAAHAMAIIAEEALKEVSR